jgi:hypothetical protein
MYIRGLQTNESCVGYTRIVVKKSACVHRLTVNESHICEKV